MIILFTKNFAILIFLVAIINAIPINFFIFQILDTDKRVVLNKVSFRWFKFPWNIMGSSARILRFCLIFWNCNKLLTKWLVESCLWRVLDESSICNGVYWMYEPVKSISNAIWKRLLSIRSSPSSKNSARERAKDFVEKSE